MNKKIIIVASNYYHDITENLYSGVVKYIEWHNNEKKSILENIDYLVLGCTHYPYLIPQLKKILPNTVTIIDSGSAVAKQTQKVLQENLLLNNSNNKAVIEFYTNKEVEVLKSLLGEYAVESKVSYLEF
mgnify:CR=1 FL=1